MGKYGLSPTDVTFIVSQKRYYDLIADAGFADITDVGSDVATKLVGAIGSVYGSPVLISDNFAGTETTSTDIAYAVNTSNFVIPRLRGVNVEQDYEVPNSVVSLLLANLSVSTVCLVAMPATALQQSLSSPLPNNRLFCKLGRYHLPSFTNTLMAKNLITLQEYKDMEGISNPKDDYNLDRLISSVSVLVKTYCANSIVDFYNTIK